MTREEMLKEQNSTKGATEIPWDDLWDFSLYTKTQVKLETIVYEVVECQQKGS